MIQLFILCLYQSYRLEKKREYGMINYKKMRNPMMVEKSPRADCGFEYNPPPALPVEERWKYPETDWGLMAKFRSQKQTYDAIYAKEANYKNQIESLNRIRNENQQRIQAEFERQKTQYDVDKKQRELADQARFESIMALNADSLSSRNSSKHHKVKGEMFQQYAICTYSTNMCIGNIAVKTLCHENISPAFALSHFHVYRIPCFALIIYFCLIFPPIISLILK